MALNELTEKQLELHRIQTDFRLIQIRKDMPAAVKAIHYAELMTELERDHGISILGDNRDNRAFPLYREISQSREF